MQHAFVYASLCQHAQAKSTAVNMAAQGGAPYQSLADLFDKAIPLGCAQLLSTLKGSSWPTMTCIVVVCCFPDVVLQFYGYEVSTEGDAFLVAFHEPFDAVAWCLCVQLALHCESPTIAVHSILDRPIFDQREKSHLTVKVVVTLVGQLPHLLCDVA